MCCTSQPTHCMLIKKDSYLASFDYKFLAFRVSEFCYSYEQNGRTAGIFSISFLSRLKRIQNSICTISGNNEEDVYMSDSVGALLSKWYVTIPVLFTVAYGTFRCILNVWATLETKLHVDSSFSYARKIHVCLFLPSVRPTFNLNNVIIIHFYHNLIDVVICSENLFDVTFRGTF